MVDADIIIKSEAIFTGLTDEPIKGAIIIRGNKIIDVVPVGESIMYIGNDTRIFDCGDNLVCPGFNDAHIHFLQAGLVKNGSFYLNLKDVTEKDETLALIEEFANSHADNAWVIGCDFNYDKWSEQPNRHMLDEIVPDRPAFFASWDMHVGWFNTKAIEAVGYTKDTLDPEGGFILREEDGTPSGLAYEAAAIDPIWGLANLSCDVAKALASSIKEAVSYGVTAMGVVWPYGGLPEDEHMRIFQELEKADKLPIRVTVFPKMEKDLANAKRWRNELTSEHLRFGGVKQITDGVCEAHTAYLTEPYADDPLTCGESTIKRGDLETMVAQADSEGMSVRLHCIGNGAVRQALDVFEAVQRRNGAKGLHNAIEHVESCCPEDFKRFADLGVVPSMQPVHAVLNTEGYPMLVGEKWRPCFWPVKSLLDAKAIVAYGTDAPVWGLNPMEGLYAAVTRQNPWDGRPSGGFVPEQRISLAQALRAYTYGSAYVENFEEQIGTLRAGMLADIVVMNCNLFKVESDELLEAKPLYTFIDGELVFDASASAQ